MNPSSSKAPIRTNYQHTRSSNVRSKILKNEEQRIQLEQRLRSMSTNTPRSHQRKQIQHIQTYFTRLNQDSQRAEQRNLQLLNELTQAQQRLDQLHDNAEHLIRLKNDYLTYLESNYPNWQRPDSTQTSTNIDSSNEYDRLVQHRTQLQQDGNLRHSVRQSDDVDSSMLFKRYEDQLKVGFDRTISPSTPVLNHEPSSPSESNEIPPPFSRVKRNGSLRMELTRTGLYFLLDYIEKELKDTIDKKKFYRLDPPTITQKRTILDIANEQQVLALKDLDPTTTSMVILDQLPSTIRQTTINKCLLTEEILSANIQDLDKDSAAQMLPEQDRSLWLRLIEHLSQLLKLHIMNSETIVTKFALAFLPINVFYTHDKAKSLLRHIIEKLAATPSSNPDDEISMSKQAPIKHVVTSQSSWMKKITSGSAFDDDEQSTTSTATPRAIDHQDNSDLDFLP